GRPSPRNHQPRILDARRAKIRSEGGAGAFLNRLRRKPLLEIRLSTHKWPQPMGPFFSAQTRGGVAVGTCVSSHAPRTDPYVRLSRIRLLPRVCDGTSCRIRASACDTRTWL